MIGETVVRLRAGSTANRYGGVDKDWVDADEESILGCSIVPRVNPESTGDGREGVPIGWTVYAPADADVLPTDRLRIRDGEYEVDGIPAEWRSPYTGAPEGLEIQARRVDG